MDYLWSAVDVNVLKTYTNPLNKNEIPFNTGCDGIQIPSLRIMCLNKIAEHWKGNFSLNRFLFQSAS